MASKNGLLAPQATYGALSESYYLSKDAPIIAPTLVSPITLQSGGAEGTLAVPAEIFVPGPDHASPAYAGAVRISPGANVDAPNGAAGVVIRAVEGTVAGTAATVMEIGTNGESPNQLLIAGADGLSQVYDELYNQPVALQAITLSATNPLAAPDPANVGEIFRCVQAGVAASAVGAIGTNFAVPKTGWYALQLEIALGNAPAPAAPDINVPIAAVGGIDIGQTLSFVITKGVVVEPYGAMEYVAQEFAAADIVVAGGNVIKQFVSQHLFTAGQTYSFTLKSSSALWNIGTNGQIKAELIAMC